MSLAHPPRFNYTLPSCNWLPVALSWGLGQSWSVRKPRWHTTKHTKHAHGAFICTFCTFFFLLHSLSPWRAFFFLLFFLICFALSFWCLISCRHSIKSFGYSYDFLAFPPPLFDWAVGPTRSPSTSAWWVGVTLFGVAKRRTTKLAMFVQVSGNS